MTDSSEPQPIYAAPAMVHTIDNAVHFDGERFQLAVWTLPCPVLINVHEDILRALERMGPQPSLHACGHHAFLNNDTLPEDFT